MRYFHTLANESLWTVGATVTVAAHVFVELLMIILFSLADKFFGTNLAPELAHLSVDFVLMYISGTILAKLLWTKTASIILFLCMHYSVCFHIALGGETFATRLEWTPVGFFSHVNSFMIFFTPQNGK